MHRHTGIKHPLEHDRPAPLSLGEQAQAGERVLAQAVNQAQLAWGNRLLAAYALGSLAHGGFSIHVSDVDVGFILREPAESNDAAIVDKLSDGMRASSILLGDRLSVFWGTVSTLTGDESRGRFPLLDLLDLKQFGRLLAGSDIRSVIRSPSTRELVVSSARFALRILSTAEAAIQLTNPAALVNAGLKRMTKLALYPARLLFTAHTGQVGINDKAVEHFLTLESGPAAQLVKAAFAWRFEPPEAGSRDVIKLLHDGLLPLYRIFLKDYQQRLNEYHETELAHAYGEWQRQLDNSCLATGSA